MPQADAETIAACRCGRLLFGVQRALDGGWERPTGVLRRFVVIPLTFDQAYGAGLVTGMLMWCVFWEKNDAAT